MSYEKTVWSNGDVITAQKLNNAENGIENNNIWLDNLQDQIDDLSNSIAEEYSTSGTYAVGDYVIYDGKLYRCTTAIATAEAWTAGHWTQVALADDVTDLKSDFNNIDESIVKKASAIEQTVNGNPIVIEDGGEDLSVSNIKINIEPIQSGSGTPSPGNKRTLSGTDKIDFYKVAINVWNEDWEHGYYGDSSGTIVAFPSDTIIRSKPFPVEPNTEYRLLVDDTSYDGGFFIGMIEDLATMHGYGIARGTDQYKVVTTGANTHYMCFALKDTYGSTYKNDVSVNCPSSDTHYHKGTNNVYAEISLGQTVYGGELDLTSGKLTPLYELITYDGTQGELYDLPSSNGFYLYLGMKSGTLQDGQCDIAPTKEIDTSNGYGVRFGLGNTAIYLDQFKTELGVSTVADFKTYCATNPIQFVQPIRNVSEIQLNPIEVLTALGYNRFKCNAHTMDITYGVDTTTYMKQFEELLENIPEYFESQLDSAIETAKDNIFETGIGGDDFIFITDVHWQTNTKHSPAMIKKIIGELNINKIVCGGDLIGGGAKADNIDLMVDCVSKFKDITRFYCLFGNHDDNSAGTAEANHFTKSESYALMQKQTDFVMNYGSLCYFYFDNPTTKTRFICLDSNYIGTQLSDEQSAWLTSTLNSMPSGYHAIVFSHIMYDVVGYNYRVGVTPEDLFLTDFGSAVCTILDTFNANNNDKKVEAVFAGHVHIDANFTTTGGIPIVITNCDSRQTLVDDGTGQADHAEGTVKEQCFDIVTVDYTKSTIKCVRVGRGSDRTITY